MTSRVRIFPYDAGSLRPQKTSGRVILIGQVPHAHEKNWKEDEVGLPELKKKRRWKKLRICQLLFRTWSEPSLKSDFYSDNV